MHHCFVFVYVHCVILYVCTVSLYTYNCRCALLPVIPDFSAMPNQHGVVDTLSGGNTPESLADTIYRNAKNVEPPVTEFMTSMADKLDVRLTGLKNKLKKPKSLAEKIELLAASDFNGDIDLAAASIKDALRYTMVVDSPKYANSVTESLKLLDEMNYSAKVKNFWVFGTDYKGINIQLVSPTGQRIELQFHTPESLKVKGIIHDLYESWRVLNPNSSEALLLQSEMIKQSATLVMPVGTELLK